MRTRIRIRRTKTGKHLLKLSQVKFLIFQINFSVEELFKVEDIEDILTPVLMEDKAVTHLRIIDDAFPMESWKETI